MTISRKTVMATMVVLLVAASCVHAYGPHVEHESWWDSFTNRVSSWLPWGNKLGHDWSETHHKVEAIYQESHDEAQRRVEDLKEESLRSVPEVQRKIAEIYAEAAAKAERRIENLRHPMLEWFTEWRKKRDLDHHEHDHDHHLHTGFKGAFDKSKHMASEVASKVQEEMEALPHKISHGYRTALEQAKHSMENIGSSVAGNWDEAKAKAAEAYSEAFHKGHGKTRTLLGRFRETINRGISGTAHFVHDAACKAWNPVKTAFMALFWTALGAVGTLLGLSFWSKRRFNNQLNSHVSGPIVAVGEYMVLGDEAAQRKFYEFWSGPAHNWFARQPGLRKYWLHRGVAGADNNWLCYSEWESIDALRRAHNHPEFSDIKRRAPKPALKQMIVYQLGSIAPADVDPNQLRDTTGGLRQRATVS